MAAAARGCTHPVAVEEQAPLQALACKGPDGFQVNSPIRHYLVEVFHEHRFGEHGQFLQGSVRQSLMETLIKR